MKISPSIYMLKTVIQVRDGNKLKKQERNGEQKEFDKGEKSHGMRAKDLFSIEMLFSDKTSSSSSTALKKIIQIFITKH